MRKIIIILSLILVLLLIPALVTETPLFNKTENPKPATNQAPPEIPKQEQTTEPTVTKTSKQVKLDVPFTPEVPENKWVKPWNNACEEASIAMVQAYYAGKSKLTKTEAKDLMWPYFGIEDKLWGSNADTDATRTAKLINDYSNFKATIITNPTLDDIKAQLAAGHPVISFHYGKNLPNPNHRWRAGGSYYHVMVIVGYDDKTHEFLTNDNGDYYTGLDYRYKYDTILSTLHDFNYKNHKADGPARVLFTEKK